jgi:predicted flap endonuclease-1-like 5' DNA nuclease
MLYLATQFAWFLLAAFGIGLAMGWITCTGGKVRFWTSPITLLVGVWAVVAALTWLQVVNGVAALWLESALLYVAAYLAGCCLACFVRTIFAHRDSVLAIAGANAGSIPETPAGPAVAALKPVLVQSAPLLDKVEGEDLISGRRPSGLVAARSGKADDLKLIKGIGQQNEGRLHSLGIWHFEQIAAWTPENIEWVGHYLAFPGRIEREDWVAQAYSLAAGIETAFSTRARAGEVEASRDDGTQGQGNVAGVPEDGADGKRR